MGMNVNRGFFNFKPNWKENTPFQPGREINRLETESLKPGNMTPKGKSVPIEDILKNLDNPDIPKF